MEVGARWWVSVAAVAVGVALVVGVLSWRVASALPASWTSLAPISAAPSSAIPSGQSEYYTAKIPAGWTVPANTYGQVVAFEDANKNRVSGDPFNRQTADRACAYLVDQQLSFQKYTRTDISGAKVGDLPAVAVRLEAGNENHLFRCFTDKTGQGSFYLQLRYAPKDKQTAEKEFGEFADSFRLR